MTGYEQLPDQLERLLTNAFEIPDDNLVIACASAAQASALTAQLYEENDDEVFHIEHYPVADDDAGTLWYYVLAIRWLTYDRNLGWFSDDVDSDPDFDLRDERSPTEADGLQESTGFDTFDKRRYVVAAETVHDPHHNYTSLGRIVELDRSEFDSQYAAAMEAAKQAVDTMLESIDDIRDDEFHVMEINARSQWVSVEEVREK